MNRCTGVAVCLLALCMVGPADANEAEIQAVFTSYLDAVNEKNLDALAAAWAEQGTHVDRETGERTEGRDAIRADLAAAFELRPNSRISGRLERIRFIKPDVASVEGETTLVASPEDEPSVTGFAGILVKTGEQWLIDTMEEMPVPRPATSYDALRPLEWLVGQWVDAGEDVRVDTTVRWTNDRAFLLRSFVVQTAEGVTQQGTQVIGWDPRAQQIRSWSFNSDGSFGDGMWSRNGDDWLIRATQTLADGRAASGTYVLHRGEDDSMSVELIGHEIEGEPQPSQDPVRVVRAPPVAPPAPPESEDN